MDEKLYKKIKVTGGWNIVLGVVSIVVGLTSGIMLIVSGAKLLAHKSDVLF